MVQTVARQQELRLRLLIGAYQGFVNDPQAFWDLLKLDVTTPPRIERADPEDEDDTPQVHVDLSNPPASPGEVRAAAFYLLERGLLLNLPEETLKAQNLDSHTLMLHITAGGVDALETYVMTNHLRALERPVGFRLLESDAERMVGMPRAAAQAPAPGAEPGPLEAAPRNSRPGQP